MRNNPRIAALFDGLAAAGVQHRCNWQARRDGKSMTTTRRPDVEHLAFVGDGFSPSISTAVLIDYGDGYGLYLEAPTNSISDDVAAICKPREEAKPAPVADHADDTIDALVQAESFISGFEGDELQEGIADLLAGLRAAIKRERSEASAVALLREAVEAWPQTELPAEMRSPGCIPDELEECEINGGDLVEWWGGFYSKAKGLTDGAPPTTESTLAVVLEGGMVSAVVGTGDMLGRKVHIIDYDTDGDGDENAVDIGQADGSTARAYYGIETVEPLVITLPAA